MNNNSITKDIKDLNSGILPDTLNFSLTQRPFDIKDLQKVKELQYNAFYKSFEYHESKFPKGHEGIPGFDKIIQSIADNSLSPLEEMELRQSQQN